MHCSNYISQKTKLKPPKRGSPQHWYINTFTTGSNSVCTKGFYNSTVYSYKPYLIHGALPAWYNGHELSITALSIYHLIKKNAECSVSTAHPCWAPYTLDQVHNPTAIELHCFEHSYREHFVSAPLELMLVYATKFCERDLIISNRQIVYSIVTL